MRLVRYTPARVMESANAAFRRIPKADVRALLERKQALSVKHGMTMQTDAGKPKVIDLQLRPWTFDAAQAKFFHRACLLMRQALAQVLPLYLADDYVRKVVPLFPKEHDWVMEINLHRLQQPQTVFDRLDATATFSVPDWRENFWFLEPNSVGIGGVHYMPATCALNEAWVFPVLRDYLPGPRFVRPDDTRRLLLKMMQRHARKIGRRLRRIALVEDRSAMGGTDEFGPLARYYSRLGIPTVVADPREITVRGAEVTVNGRPVDLFYRDSEIEEMLEMMHRDGERCLGGIKEAFIRNQVVSSIAGEFDHKSTWELFTNPEFARHFSLRQRLLFRKHVLWTRLIWERETTDPKGRPVDLARYARRHRETLTIKPNRAYGGEGVYFGHELTQAEWERRLERALKKPGTHVVQQQAQVRAELFPVAQRDGGMRLEPYYCVTGFAATPDGMAVLGRSSKEAVVNVSRKGGLIAIWRLG
ncbi:MAG: hypothetical protein HYZ94_00580 [Candidatus Omnitrophica bacterium]|nr:hypothetical protein [Candidatus Omnitrophota bacterium]